MDLEFLKAVKEGNIGKVTDLLSKGANVDSKDSEGRTALMLAEGADVVELLIKNGANLNAQDNEGNSVLFFRIQPLLKVKVPDMDDLAESKRLIESGAELEYKARKGDDQHTVSILNLAIRNQNLPLVKFLVENGANPNHDPGGLDEYPLFLAVGAAGAPANIGIAEFLLASGAKPVFTSRLKEQPGARGTKQVGARNAFHYATESRAADYKIFELLAKVGTDINHRDAEGKTPLMEAIQRDNIIAAEALISLGADLNLSDNEGKTALDMAKAAKLQSIEKKISEKLFPKDPNSP
ncbi:ankyrin repeat domain-containing protein [Leptospira perolatii]|nr:ankyrin repeat domain-containing protein [Leptospira perolatii]